MKIPTPRNGAYQRRTPPTAPSVFISYRTGQSTGSAILLFELLRRRLPDVFRDKNCLNYGESWPERLDSAVKQCQAVVVVIGKGWAEEFALREAAARGQTEKGEKAPVDWVKREIQLALENRKKVIPVREVGVDVPSARDLPPGFETFPATEGGQLHPEHYKGAIEKVIQAVWRYPPWLYWSNGGLLLGASLVWALWGLFPWWLAGAPFLLLNLLALSGMQYRLLPGASSLRGLFSRGMITAPLLALLLLPFLLTRIEVGCVDCAQPWAFTVRNSAQTIVYSGSANRAQGDWTWFWRPATKDLFLWRDGCFPSAIPAAKFTFDRRQIDVGRNLTHKAVIIQADPESWKGQWGGQQYLRVALFNGSERVFLWDSPELYQGQPVGFGARVEGGFSNPVVEALAATAEVEISFDAKGPVQDSVQGYRTRRFIGFREGQPARVVFSR